MKRLKRLVKVLGAYKYTYLLAGVLLIATSLIRMLEPKILQVALDYILLPAQNKVVESEPGWVASALASLLPLASSTAVQLLLFLALLYIGIAISRGVASLLAGLLVSSATERSAQTLRDKLFSHVLRMPLQTHDELPSGEVLQRCTGDVDTVRRFLLNDVAEMIRLSALFVAAFLMMFSVHIPYAFAAIALVPFIAINSFLFFRKEAIVWEAHEEQSDKLTAAVRENLAGIRVVHAFAKESQEVERFEKINKAKLDLGIQHVKLHASFWPISDALINLQVAFSLTLGAYLALSQMISLGEFASFFTYSIMVTWPLRQVGQIASRMGMAMVALDRMSEILEKDLEQYDGLLLDASKLQGQIEFRNVSFSYPGKPDKKILDGLSFKIEAGQQVGIIGPTGAGKSSLIALLLRFYEPSEGEILLDGTNIAEIDKQSLRKELGTVLQRAFLFSSSLLDNIRYGKPDQEEIRVNSAIEQSGLSALVSRLPDALETPVGEKGLSLSGGQRQRTSIARVLSAQPGLYLFDDSLSAVDTLTEASVLQGMSENARDGLNRKTQLLIAHRLSVLRHAEHILVLEKGRLTQQGSHEALYQQPGYYRKVADLQDAESESQQSDELELIVK
jgi:ATP-binding cassette subfamily B protein